MKARLLALFGVAAAAAVLWLVLRQPASLPSMDRTPVNQSPSSLESSAEGANAGPRVLADGGGSDSPPTSTVDASVVNLFGYVRDVDANPIVGAKVLAMGFSRNAAETDEKGRYRLPTPIRRGASLIVHVSCPRFLVEEVNVTAQEDSPADIVLERAPRIAGILVDPRGEPIEGYRLQAVDEAGKPLAFAITDARGQFDLCRREAKTEGRVVVSEMFTYGHGLLVERPSVSWGTENVMLRTHSAGQLEIRVKRADDATPVTAFSVCLLHHEHQGPQGWDVSRPVGSTSDDGVIQLRSIPGPVSFVVIAEDASLQPSDVQMVHVPGIGVHVAHVSLSPGRVQRIRAFDRQTGLVVANADVRIVVGTSDPEKAPDATLPQVSELQGIRILAWSRSGVRTKAKTGPDGTAIVRWVGPATEAWLRCEHPQYRTANVKLTPSSEPIAAEVGLDRCIRIRGVVTPADILQFMPRVRAVEERKSLLQCKWMAVDAQTGGFELDVDNPGSVRLDLAVTMPDGVPVLTAEGIARVVVGSESSSQVLVLDCTAHVPGVVEGVVAVDGRTPAKVRAHRVLDGVGHVGWAAEVVVGEDGSFVIAPMLVGEWLLSAVPPNAGPFDYRPVFFATCTVQAGRKAHVVGQVTTTALEVVVCDASGASLAEGQQMILALKRCPERRFTAKLGPGGLLRVEGIPSNETVVAEVQGGPYDKRRGETEVVARQLVVR